VTRRRLVVLLDPVLQSAAAQRVVTTAVRLWLSSISRLPPDEAIRRLLGLSDRLYERVDWLAIELDGGVHAKHRLTGYHDFFVEHVRPGEAVLDVGCGKGELAHDLAVRGGASVTGIDRDRASLAFARDRFDSDGVAFVEADVFAWQPERPFDVVVLSNVLEHVADRVALLRWLVEAARPTRILVRVPSRERDWLVPLRRELGLSHHSHPEHEIEYTVDELRGELAAAGLHLDELVQRWGELWAVARPRPTE